MQVVGGPLVCALVRELFPLEVEIGKIVLTDLGYDNMTWVGRELLDPCGPVICLLRAHCISAWCNSLINLQKRVTGVLTSQDFYDRLVGDTWLFFQVRSQERLNRPRSVPE
jgi:hypothetical protein